jgi:hypothetical protein
MKIPLISNEMEKDALSGVSTMSRIMGIQYWEVCRNADGDEGFLMLEPPYLHHSN